MSRPPEGRLHTERFVRKLLELGYTYRGENKLTRKYRKGGMEFVYVPKRELVAVSWARAALRKCGEPDAAVAAFIQAARD
jgi:hypothetical protein